MFAFPVPRREIRMDRRKLTDFWAGDKKTNGRNKLDFSRSWYSAIYDPFLETPPPVSSEKSASLTPLGWMDGWSGGTSVWTKRESNSSGLLHRKDDRKRSLLVHII